MIKFSEIVQLAIKLGAQEYAIAKWRQRGIPPGWQIKLFTANNRFGFADLSKIGPGYAGLYE